MKELLKKLALKGYEIRNKRILGNPLYTSEETKVIDKTQETALICKWLRDKYGIHIEVYFDAWNKETYDFSISIKGRKDYHYDDIIQYNTVEDTYLAAFDYILKELI